VGEEVTRAAEIAKKLRTGKTSILKMAAVEKLQVAVQALKAMLSRRLMYKPSVLLASVSSPFRMHSLASSVSNQAAICFFRIVNRYSTMAS
jgi:hypothetical protein